MYDREIKEIFNFSKSLKLFDYPGSNKWFGVNSNVEPIWITNRKAGPDRFSLIEWAGADYMWDNKTSFRINNFEEKKEKYYDLSGEIVEAISREKEPVNFVAIYLDKLGKYYLFEGF